MALKVLREIKNERDDLELRTIDVVAHPALSWNAGVRMIPTIEVEGRKLSGVFLDKVKITAFLEDISPQT